MIEPMRLEARHWIRFFLAAALAVAPLHMAMAHVAGPHGAGPGHHAADHVADHGTTGHAAGGHCGDGPSAEPEGGPCLHCASCVPPLAATPLSVGSTADTAPVADEARAVVHHPTRELRPPRALLV